MSNIDTNKLRAKTTSKGLDVQELRIRVEEDGKSGIDLEEIHELLDRIEAAEHLNAEWLKANAPGGWIDDLRAKAAETENLREGLKRMCLDEDADAKEARVLRAKIERMEQQTPVGHVYRYGKDSHGRQWHGIYWYDPNLDVPTDTKLYTLPGAKGEEK